MENQKKKHYNVGKNNPMFGVHRFEKKAPNYIDGRRNVKHYCIEKNCNNKISYTNWKTGQRRCVSCAKKIGYWANKKRPKMKGENNPAKRPEVREKMKKNHFNCKGKNHPNYINGKSREPYTLKFTEQLKELIRKRDNYQCQNCSMTQKEHLIVYNRKIEVHHIDYNKKNCKDNNLITLCKQCNIRANYNRSYWKIYFKKKLKLINP